MQKKDQFAQIRVKLVRNSYEFHRNFCIHTLAEHIRLYEIRVLALFVLGAVWAW